MIWVGLNIKQFKMRSPDRKLSASDIGRKTTKLDKTLRQLDNLTEGTRKYHRKLFKAEKTLDQVRTGRSGIRPTKQPYKKSSLEMLGISRKASPLNDMTAQENAAASLVPPGFTAPNEKVLGQEQRDSLHDQANKFGKPFFSEEFNVNVDPEDGVLDVEPTFGEDIDNFEDLPENKRGGYTPEELESLYPKSRGRKLTYDIENKPIEELVKEAYTNKLNEYLSNVGKKKHPMLPAQTEEEARNEFFNESHSTRFNPKTRKIEDLKNPSGDGAISEEELAKIPSYLRNPL